MRPVFYSNMGRNITFSVLNERLWNSMEFYSGSLQVMWGRPPGAKKLDDLLGEPPSPPFVWCVLVNSCGVSLAQRTSTSDSSDQRPSCPVVGCLQANNIPTAPDGVGLN